MAEKFPLVKLNNIYLTDNNLINGARCRVEISNLSQFVSRFTLVATQASDGNVYTQRVDVGQKGKILILNIAYLSYDKIALIVNILPQSLNTVIPINLEITDHLLGAAPILLKVFPFQSQANAGIGELFSFGSRNISQYQNVQIPLVSV